MKRYLFAACPGRLRPRQCTDEAACEPSHDIGNGLWVICESAAEMLLTIVDQLEAIYNQPSVPVPLYSHRPSVYGRVILSRCHSEAVHSDATATGSFPPKPANPLLSSFDTFCKEIYAKKIVSFL